jgi:hypothetical protein
VTNGKSFPKDVIDRWPEVFGEVTLNVVPLSYLHAVKVTFKNNKIWEIEIKQESKANWDSFEKHMREMISEYEDRIESIDFRLDTDRIKKDIERNTKKFLNNRKLK